MYPGYRDLPTLSSAPVHRRRQATTQSQPMPGTNIIAESFRPSFRPRALGRIIDRNGIMMLSRLLSSSEIIQAPGAYDCLSARLVEAAGFPVVYMTGFGTAASYLGRPDVGLLGMSEMVDNARRIVDAVSLPVIADADTGYGNAINVIRTVHAYERAGVAGIHIEDQVAPKKCGHLEGKQLIPAAKWYRKSTLRSTRATLQTSQSLPERMHGLSRVLTGLSSAHISTARPVLTFCLSKHRKPNKRSKRSLRCFEAYRSCS